MKTVTLLPATKRLKQLIKEFGPAWTVLQELSSVKCFNGGPGVFIESLHRQHSRWVHPTDIQA